MPFEAPLLAPFETIRDEWIDYNGHLNMAYYTVLFDHGVDHAFSLIGCGPDYARTRGLSTFTAEAHVRYLRELKPGARVRASFQLVEADEKKMRSCQSLFHEDGWLAATCENMHLHVDLSGPRVVAFPADIASSIAEMRRSHAALALPDHAGRGIALDHGAKADAGDEQGALPS